MDSNNNKSGKNEARKHKCPKCPDDETHESFFTPAYRKAHTEDDFVEDPYGYFSKKKKAENKAPDPSEKKKTEKKDSRGEREGYDVV